VESSRLSVFQEVVPPARDAGLRVRGYVSTVWGCPYEGDVDPARAVAISERLVELGCYQVSLGDTIGVGTPRQTADIVARFADALPLDKIALHLHDTRGTALANVLVGLELGIREFDASLGGLGDVAAAFRRALDTGVASLAARLTPRLRLAASHTPAPYTLIANR
jgi:hydroxymethylglutaryl-CoA lyase